MRSKLERAWVYGDADLLERLVENLVGNAIRHNTHGGWIELGTRTSGTNAVLTVANTGPLIPTDVVARLFEPFNQLVGPSVRGGGGLGLGLSVAKAVVDAHGAFTIARARSVGGLHVEVAFSAARRAAGMLSN